MYYHDNQQKQELASLRRERTVWFYEKEGLTKRIADLESSLANERNVNSQLMQERNNLKAELQTARISLPYKSGDIVNDFLASFHLTRKTIVNIADQVKRRDLVRKLKKIAAMSFHPNNGLSPNEERLKVINGFLNQYD